MTLKLYDSDSHLSEFDCKVISLDRRGDDLAIETDRTAFFPEGGGQTSDRGQLGGLYVKDVQIECGKLLHIVENYEENIKNLNIGDILHGKIDFQKRFSDMQQHTGEHIFSGVVHRLYGFENIGFHLGDKIVTLDFDGVLTMEQACQVEVLVNRAIWENRPVRVFYPTAAEAEALSYRSKKEIAHDLRLVEIEGVDLCACCAPHVKFTGEVGIVTVISCDRHRGGTRLGILCGERALMSIRHRLDENHRCAVMLSSNENETYEAVRKLKDSLGQTSFRLAGAIKRLNREKARGFAQSRRIVEFTDSENMDSIREYADMLSDRCDEFAIVFSDVPGEKKFAAVSKTGYDLNALIGRLRDRFGAKGGGRGGIVQGSVSCAKSELVKELG